MFEVFSTFVPARWAKRQQCPRPTNGWTPQTAVVQRRSLPSERHKIRKMLWQKYITVVHLYQFASPYLLFSQIHSRFIERFQHWLGIYKSSSLGLSMVDEKQHRSYSKSTPFALRGRAEDILNLCFLNASRVQMQLAVTIAGHKHLKSKSWPSQTIKDAQSLGKGLCYTSDFNLLQITPNYFQCCCNWCTVLYHIIIYLIWYNCMCIFYYFGQKRHYVIHLLLRCVLCVCHNANKLLCPATPHAGAKHPKPGNKLFRRHDILMRVWWTPTSHAMELFNNI